MTSEQIKELASNAALIEVGRKAVEAELIAMRDARVSLLGAGNGLVCRERDGQDSHIIRIGTGEALVLALQAMAKAVE